MQAAVLGSGCRQGCLHGLGLPWVLSLNQTSQLVQDQLCGL